MKLLERLLFVSIILSVAACTESETDLELSPRAVVVFEVEASTQLSAPVYSGTLRAKQRSDLSFLQSGQIVELTKELGEQFEKGEILARLDNTELNLAAAERKANLIDAQAELADAELSHERLTSLEGSGAVSKSAIDSAIARLDSAEARVSGIEAALGQASQRLSEAVLIAPYDGQVVERLLEPSQTAAAGQAVYRIIGNQGGLEAIINIPVSALELFVTGYQTELIVRPYGTPKTARVVEIGNAAGRSGLYPLVLAILNPEGLRPGLRVEVPGRLTDVGENKQVIPLTAYLAKSRAMGLVFVIDLDTGLVSEREVELGAITDEGIEVISGLSIGDTIVARGLSSLRNGDVVVPLGVGTERFNE